MRTHLAFGRPLEGDLEVEAVKALLAEARERQAALADQPIEAILRILERVGADWADPNFPARQQAQATLPGQLGFAPEMVALELDGLAMALSTPYLEAKLRTELGRLDAGDTWHRRPGTEGFAKALPRGVVLHVASGNVSTTGVLSLVEGLLAKNINVLKVASNAPLLPRLFAESLMAHDPDGVVSRSFAILSWPGNSAALHEVFCQEADAIVVWGGDEVMDAYRRALGPHTRLVPYGPKVSCALLGAESLAPGQLEATAQGLARDVALWDQNACSSPQVAYLETSDVTPFVTALAKALQGLARELPMGPLDLHERAEITKERELALADQLMGLGSLHVPADGGPGWTIVVERDPAFKLSPLFRTITLKPVPRLEDALPQLVPYRTYLQTVALAVGPARSGRLAEALARTGALRVTRVGETSGGFPGEPHDGLYGLNELVRWVALDTPEAAQAFDGTIFDDAAHTDAVARARRQRLVETILPRAPYYRGRLEAADWLALPILDKATLVAQTPPSSQGLLTAAPEGGHWLRSGGSTGAPKLSIYSFEDYEADMWRAARGAHAAGLRRGDKVANLFHSGDMYGSYLSLNRALELIGCNAFSLTQTPPPEAVLAAVSELGIDTLMGISTRLQAVLAAAMAEPERWPGLKVRRLFYAGEPFAAAERAALMERLGIELIASIGYGGVDAGPMGFQCAHCRGDVHHVHADHVFMEILDPESWQPTTAAGEVVITSLNRRLMPLLRYRVGDRARWVPEPCPCGRGSARFELLGRSDDRVRLADFDFQLGDVEAVTSAIAALHAVPQVELAGNKSAERVIVRAELMALMADVTELAKEVRMSLLARVPDLASIPLTIEILPPGGLAVTGRAGKAVRLLDRREGSS